MNTYIVTNWTWQNGNPDFYGWFHLLWIFITIAISFVLCRFVASKHNPKIDDIVIFSFGAYLIAIEIYKEVFNVLIKGYYPMNIFPFQYCSVPMYIAFIAPLIKNKLVKDACYKFIAFIGFLGGLAVMVYPVTIKWTPYITMANHTLSWHSVLIIMGVYLMAARNYGVNYLSDLIESFSVFAILALLAQILNISIYNIYLNNPELNTHNEMMNLFSFSPYYPTYIPIADFIKNKSFLIYFFGYISVIFVAVSIIWLVFSHTKAKLDLKFPHLAYLKPIKDEEEEKAYSAPSNKESL